MRSHHQLSCYDAKFWYIHDFFLRLIRSILLIKFFTQGLYKFRSTGRPYCLLNRDWAAAKPVLRTSSGQQPRLPGHGQPFAATLHSAAAFGRQQSSSISVSGHEKKIWRHGTTDRDDATGSWWWWCGKRFASVNQGATCSSESFLGAGEKIYVLL